MNVAIWLDFAASRVEVFFALVFGFVGLTALLYSLARVRGRPGQLVEYYLFVLILVGAGVGVLFAQNLVLTFGLWEVATVAIWRLVSFGRGDEDVTAANWALYLNFAATAVMLVGLGFVLAEMGTASLADLAGAPLSSGTAMLLLVGILAKSATLPLYIWLPRAYEAAPAPVCALLSGVAENIGIALFYRLFVATFAVPAGFLPFCAGLALVSSLVAGGIALRAGSMRRLLAYSTVSQLGFILLGFSVGGYYGLAGALLYMAGHAVAKAGLFFAAGSVQDACGTDELDRLGGLARSSPALAVAAAVLAFSVIGLPPMVGFFAKLGVMVGAARAGILPAAGAAVAALFTLLYLGRFYSAVFLGETRVVPSRPVSHLAVALVVLMALVALAGGLGWFLPVRFLGAGAGWLMGGL